MDRYLRVYPEQLFGKNTSRVSSRNKRTYILYHPIEGGLSNQQQQMSSLTSFVKLRVSLFRGLLCSYFGRFDNLISDRIS